MRAVATFFVLALLGACAMQQATLPGIPGTYDLVSFGGQAMPTQQISRLWMVMTPQGTWEMYEEPGTVFGGTRGIYAMGDTLDTCFSLSFWPESNPGARVPMQVCPQEENGVAYLTPSWLRSVTLDGPMVFKKRE